MKNLLIKNLHVEVEEKEILKEIFEDAIKSDDWLIENFEGEIPLLATIPEEGNHGKYGKCKSDNPL